MKYLAVLRQEGGCDYTIGCGINTIEFEAADNIEAAKKLKLIVFENYDNSEITLKSARYYIVAGTFDVDMERWRAEFEQVRLTVTDMKIQEAELAELERLKKKYGK